MPDPHETLATFAEIRAFIEADRPACAKVLATLPEWFGIKEANFYLAKGFDELFESLTLWGPEDAALIMIKKLETRDSS